MNKEPFRIWNTFKVEQQVLHHWQLYLMRRKYDAKKSMEDKNILQRSENLQNLHEK
jgi:hypothetical protein